MIAFEQQSPTATFEQVFHADLLTILYRHWLEVRHGNQLYALVELADIKFEEVPKE